MTDDIKQATAALYAHLDCGKTPRGKVARLLERIDLAADAHIALKHAYLRLEHQYMAATGTTAHEVWSWRPAGVFGDLDAPGDTTGKTAKRVDWSAYRDALQGEPEWESAEDLGRLSMESFIANNAAPGDTEEDWSGAEAFHFEMYEENPDAGNYPDAAPGDATPRHGGEE